MTSPCRRVRLAIWRARFDLWRRRHFRICGNCSYWDNDLCNQHGWDGEAIFAPSEQPGCERWRRQRMEPEMP